jgi:hypothetical protein
LAKARTCPGAVLFYARGVEDATVTLIEWVAAVAVVLGSAAVLWAVKMFDEVGEDRPRSLAAPRRRREPPYRKAA